MKNKRERKLKLLKVQPNCPCCGCAMVVTDATPKGRSAISHAAMVIDGGLVCFGCSRGIVKEREINSLPVLIRWKKKVDRATGLFTLVRRGRTMVNQFIYFKIRGGKPTSKMPAWLAK